MRFKFSYLLQSILIAIFPALFFYGKNSGETYFFDFLFAISCFTTFLIITFFIFNLIFKDYIKSSIFTSIFSLIFFNIGFFIGALETISFYGIRLFRWRYIMVLCIAFLIYMFIKIYKTKQVHQFFIYFLVFPFLVLNAYSAFNVFSNWRKGMHLVSTYKEQITPFVKEHFKDVKSVKAKLPNVYFIILDRYFSKETLLRKFDYDNSEFLDSLSKMGFVLPKGSYSNYDETTHSLSSSLNMIYNYKDLATEPVVFHYLSEYMIRNNLVTLFFRNNGYGTIVLPSHWQRTQELPYTASEEIRFKGIYSFFNRPLFTSSYIAMLMKTVLIAPFLERWVYEYRLRKIIKNQLNGLEKTAFIKNPTFIFAHIQIPHPPFLFDENGNSISIAYDDAQQIGTIKYINREISKVISYILKNSEREPVIILQADHGGATEKTAEGVFGILSAYYLPKKDRGIIYDGISPVNNFRVIFNHYLGGKFKLLKDSSYKQIIDDHYYGIYSEYLNMDSELGRYRLV